MFINSKLNDPTKLFSMLKNNSSLIVAVSGGSDSMCLLHLLNLVKCPKNLNLIVAHVNHCLRGQESDKDEIFVRETALKNNLKFECIKYNATQLALKSKKGIEETARVLRYNFFKDLANKYQAEIVTAHNLSDSIETVLFNLIRGTSAKGLRGIKPINGEIYRPLIEIAKEDILNFCKENKIPYREDLSNKNTEYTRNKIRNKLIPICKEINPNFETNISRLMNMIYEDEEVFFAAQVDSLREKSLIGENQYSISEMLKFNKSVVTRLIARLVSEDSSNMDFKKINMIYNMLINAEGALQISKSTLVKIRNDILSIEKIPLRSTNKFRKIRIKIPCIIQDDETKFSIEELKLKNVNNFLKKEFNNLIDCDRINLNSLCLRNREAGDKFKPINSNLHKSFKKLMQDANIPIDLRSRILVLSDGSNNLLWVEGIGVSGDFSVTEGTKRLARISIQHFNY